MSWNEHQEPFSNVVVKNVEVDTVEPFIPNLLPSLSSFPSVFGTNLVAT